jgi:nucleotide-binding universal stress UspA family protein
MSTTETKNEIGTFSKILVAIDGSKQSNDAAYYAVNVANKFNAGLYSIHVANDPLSSVDVQKDFKDSNSPNMSQLLMKRLLLLDSSA